MKSYVTYVCEECGNESTDMKEIKLCEGGHIGLCTLALIEEYEDLNRAFAQASARLSSAQSPALLKAQDDALKKLMDFEKKNGIKRQEA